MKPRSELEFAQVDLRDPSRIAEVQQLWQVAYAAELNWHRTWLQAWPDPALKQVAYPPLQTRLDQMHSDTAYLLGARKQTGRVAPAPLIGTLGIDMQHGDGGHMITSLHVDPVFHGQGVARALLGSALQSTDARTLCAHVPVGNAAARVAFGRMGFLWHRQFTSTASGLPVLELRWHRRQLDALAPIQIRQLQPHEQQLHRAIRLRALRADPDAFAERYAHIAAESDDYWQQLTLGVTSQMSGVVLIAEIDGRICGYAQVAVASVPAASALLRPGAGDAIVAGLWVDSSQRRRGAGRALMAGIFEWAHARCVATLELWAPAHRSDAMALLAELGFTDCLATPSIASGADTPLSLLRRALPAPRSNASELDR